MQKLKKNPTKYVHECKDNLPNEKIKVSKRNLYDLRGLLYSKNNFVLNYAILLDKE